MRLLNKDQQNVCCLKYSNYIFLTVFNTSFLIMFVDLLSSDLLSQRRDGQMECFCLSPPLSHSSSVITCISSIFWMDRPSSFISTFLPSFFCPTPLLSWSVNSESLLWSSEEFIAKWVPTQWSEREWWRWIDSDSCHSLVRSLSACQALFVCVTACKTTFLCFWPCSSPFFSFLPISLSFLSFFCSFAMLW